MPQAHQLVGARRQYEVLYLLVLCREPLNLRTAQHNTGFNEHACQQPGITTERQFNDSPTDRTETAKQPGNEATVKARGNTTDKGQPARPHNGSSHAQLFCCYKSVVGAHVHKSAHKTQSREMTSLSMPPPPVCSAQNTFSINTMSCHVTPRRLRVVRQSCWVESY